jgi:predicted MPP superfamily phosphohydrolase
MGFKGRLSAIVVVGGFFFLYVLSIQATALSKLEIGSNESKTIRKAHDDAPANLVWVVQMSDIHISKWTPERGKALRKSLGHALKLIKPSLVWVTGDLTGTNFLPPLSLSL